jgi:hypothetical protein
MPGLVRRVLVFAAIDGLILQPAPPRNHLPTTQQAIKIDFKGNVAPLMKDRRDEDTTPTALETHGILGIVTELSTLLSSANMLRPAESRNIVFPGLDKRP